MQNGGMDSLKRYSTNMTGICPSVLPGGQDIFTRNVSVWSEELKRGNGVISKVSGS